MSVSVPAPPAPAPAPPPGPAPLAELMDALFAPEQDDFRLDDVLVGVLECLAVEFPRSVYDLRVGIAALNTHAEYVVRKRAALILTLACPHQFVSSATALEFAIGRALSVKETRKFQILLIRWREVLEDVGTNGTPDFNEIVCACRSEARMVL